MKNIIISLTIISAIALTAVSCSKDYLFGRRDNHIRALVSASSAQTKSALSGQYGRLVASYELDGFGVDSLCMDVYEFDNNALPQGLAHNAGLQTKGAVTTNGSINQDGEQFRMDAWLESENRNTGSTAELSEENLYEQYDADDYHFMKGAVATCAGNEWPLSASGSADGWNMWRNNVPTNFWAMYPKSLSSGTISSLTLPADTAGDDAQKTLSFDYTLPAPSTDYSDAESQPDLCFAYSRETGKRNSNKVVNIKFYHALSAVYFDISGVKNTITVNKIGLNNVPSTAHCVITGTPGNPGVLSEENIVWTGQSSLTSYGQAYTSSDFDENSKVKFDEDKIFMMIPGRLDDNAKLWAEFEVDGSPVSKSVSISKNGNGINYVWKPGKFYVYRLVYNGSGELGLRGSLSPYTTDWWGE